MRSWPMYSAERTRAQARFVLRLFFSGHTGYHAIGHGWFVAAFLPAPHQLAERGLERDLEGGLTARRERGVGGLFG